ncbi:hypothetical protein FKM82_022117 [Ascaphus truei]
MRGVKSEGRGSRTVMTSASSRSRPGCLVVLRSGVKTHRAPSWGNPVRTRWAHLIELQCCRGWCRHGVRGDGSGLSSGCCWEPLLSGTNQFILS